MALTYQNLGKIIKEQYPDEYGSYDDAELGKVIIQAYPEYEDQLSYIEKSYPELLKSSPKNAAKDAWGMIGGLFSALGEGSKLFVKNVGGVFNPTIKADLQSLGQEAEKQGKSSSGLLYEEGIKPVGSAIAGGLKEEYIAPEGRGEGEFLTKRALQKPVTTAVELIPIINGIVGTITKVAGKAKAINLASKIAEQRVLTDAELKVIDSAKKMGLTDYEVNTVANLSKELKPEALKYIKQAETQAKFPTTMTPEGEIPTKSPFALVGDDIRETIKALEGHKDSIGQKIGGEVKTTKGAGVPKLGTQQVVNSVKERLKDLNVKISKNGTLDFSKSDIAGLKDVSFLKDIWSKIKPTQKKGGEGFTERFIPQRDVVALIRQIGNKLYQGKVNKELTGASPAVADIVRTGLKESLDSMKGKLAGYNKQFSELATVLDDAKRLVGQDLSKVPDISRRVFSNAGGKTAKVLQNLSKLAEKYSVPQGQNLIKKSNIAGVAENVAGVPAPQSLKGNMVSGNMITNPKAGFFDKIGTEISEKFKIPKPQALQNVVMNKVSQPANPLVNFTSKAIDKALSPIQTTKAVVTAPVKGANPFILQMSNMIQNAKKQSAPSL